MLLGGRHRVRRSGNRLRWPLFRSSTTLRFASVVNRDKGPRSDTSRLHKRPAHKVKALTKNQHCCAKENRKQEAVSLSVLMGGSATAGVTWRETSERSRYELSLPASPLPLMDATFLTGCAPSSPGKSAPPSECKLKVTVEARKSAAAGQTVYCAYGKKSNETKPTVTMTEESNKITLVCGSKDATVQPTTYKTNYCVDDKVSEDCKKEDYKNFIKDFQTDWWTSNAEPKSVSLSIPPEHFPETPKTIRLGCQYKTGGAGTTRSQEAATVCSVDVVISAKESSALARTAAAVPGLTLAAVVVSVSLLL